jgi:hypothetical protein
VENFQPISGVIIENEMYVIYRVGKMFYRKKFVFDDRHGVNVIGLWYARIAMFDCTEVENKIGDLLKKIDMATVAIPLRFGVPDNIPVSKNKAKTEEAAAIHKLNDHWKKHGNCYCAITSTWKERVKGGQYKYPDLVSDLYQDKPPTPAM